MSNNKTLCHEIFVIIFGRRSGLFAPLAARSGAGGDCPRPLRNGPGPPTRGPRQIRSNLSLGTRGRGCSGLTNDAVKNN